MPLTQSLRDCMQEEGHTQLVERGSLGREEVEAVDMQMHYFPVVPVTEEPLLMKGLLGGTLKSHSMVVVGHLVERMDLTRQSVAQHTLMGDSMMAAVQTATKREGGAFYDA